MGINTSIIETNIHIGRREHLKFEKKLIVAFVTFFFSTLRPCGKQQYIAQQFQKTMH